MYNFGMKKNYRYAFWEYNERNVSKLQHLFSKFYLIIYENHVALKKQQQQYSAWWNLYKMGKRVLKT